MIVVGLFKIKTADILDFPYLGLCGWLRLAPPSHLYNSLQVVSSHNSQKTPPNNTPDPASRRNPDSVDTTDKSMFASERRQTIKHLDKFVDQVWQMWVHLRGDLVCVQYQFLLKGVLDTTCGFIGALGRRNKKCSLVRILGILWTYAGIRFKECPGSGTKDYLFEASVWGL